MNRNDQNYSYASKKGSTEFRDSFKTSAALNLLNYLKNCTDI